SLLDEQAVDAVLINDKVTKRYLQTMEGGGCHLFITKAESFLILDGRYLEEAKGKERDLTIILWNPQDEGSSYLTWVRNYCAAHQIHSIGLENSVSVAEYAFFEKFMDKTEILSDAFEKLRMIKDSQDIVQLKEAIHTGDEIYKQVLSELYVGMTDYEISAKLQYYSIKAGAARMSFDTIIGVGESTAFPHGRPAGRVIEKNQMIMIDFGLRLNGFESDMTRMCAFGDPGEKMREIYQVVLEANQAGIAAMRAGNRACEADAAARAVTEKYGYAEYFTHGLGHGIGMDNSTELPKVNSASQMILQEGMVMSCEPGVYVPCVGGVRIEDNVWIHNGVGVQLDQSSKELTIL
ncbi:MAG: aminopeptidase P family protein, partial [Streptococcaceae bacterium]|nr:aminopeptidase P family protein [Streptococcaceae bacterium]